MLNSRVHSSISTPLRFQVLSYLRARRRSNSHNSTLPHPVHISTGTERLSSACTGLILLRSVDCPTLSGSLESTEHDLHCQAPSDRDRPRRTTLAGTTGNGVTALSEKSQQLLLPPGTVHHVLQHRCNGEIARNLQEVHTDSVKRQVHRSLPEQSANSKLLHTTERSLCAQVWCLQYHS